MNWLHFLLLFIAGFVAVFAQSFQSRNVNTGNYTGAAFSSMFIAVSQAFVWRFVTLDGAGLAEIGVYAVAGSIGVTSAMYLHQRFIHKK